MPSTSLHGQPLPILVRGAAAGLRLAAADPTLNVLAFEDDWTLVDAARVHPAVRQLDHRLRIHHASALRVLRPDLPLANPRPRSLDTVPPAA